MFSTKGRLAVTFFTTLAILLISAVGVDAGSAHGNNGDVYWDLVTNSLYRYGNYTYSTHQWFIENYSGWPVVLIQQEFRPRVMRVSDNAEMITKFNRDDIFDTVTIPNTESRRRVYRSKVDISSELDKGWYYIHAYTLIDLKDIDEHPVPEAHANTKDDPFEVKP